MVAPTFSDGKGAYDGLGFTPSDPAMPGHLPHLALAKQGRLVFYFSSSAGTSMAILS